MVERLKCDKLERNVKGAGKTVVAYSGYTSEILLDGKSKTMKRFKTSWCTGRGSKREFPEYNTIVYFKSTAQSKVILFQWSLCGQ
jgi:predicted NUDIX family NTP pyrophosphohydrolase